MNAVLIFGAPRLNLHNANANSTETETGISAGCFFISRKCHHPDRCPCSCQSVSSHRYTV